MTPEGENLAFKTDPLVGEMDMMARFARMIQGGELTKPTQVLIRDKFNPETSRMETWVYEVDPADSAQVVSLANLANHWNRIKHDSRARRRFDEFIWQEMQREEPK